MTESLCPDCGSPRPDWTKVCPACGAPPEAEHRQAARAAEGVRAADLEPYITLRYIARLFKVLAVLIIVMLLGEVVTGIVIDGTAALVTLIGEGTRLLVMAGLLWAGGDLTLLLIDAGHDLRVARILLGRINTQLHANSTRPRRVLGAAPGVLGLAAAQAPVDPNPPAPRPLGASAARVKRTRATGWTRSWAMRSPERWRGAPGRG